MSIFKLSITAISLFAVYLCFINKDKASVTQRIISNKIIINKPALRAVEIKPIIKPKVIVSEKVEASSNNLEEIPVTEEDFYSVEELTTLSDKELEIRLEVNSNILKLVVKKLSSENIIKRKKILERAVLEIENMNAEARRRGLGTQESHSSVVADILNRH